MFTGIAIAIVVGSEGSKAVYYILHPAVYQDKGYTAFCDPAKNSLAGISQRITNNLLSQLSRVVTTQLLDNGRTVVTPKQAVVQYAITLIFLLFFLILQIYLVAFL